MKEYPMTFDEFVRRFYREEECEAYLYDLRWGETLNVAMTSAGKQSVFCMLAAPVATKLL